MQAPRLICAFSIAQLDSDAATRTMTPSCHHKEAKLEAGKSYLETESVTKLVVAVIRSWTGP